MQNKQCKAITEAGTRCKRRAVDGLRGFCRQHGGDGGDFKKKAAALLPWAVAATELVKTIVEIVGPMLSRSQREALMQIENARVVPEVRKGVRKLLLSALTTAQVRRLNTHARYRRAVNALPGGKLANAQAIRLGFTRRRSPPGKLGVSKRRTLRK